MIMPSTRFGWLRLAPLTLLLFGCTKKDEKPLQNLVDKPVSAMSAAVNEGPAPAATETGPRGEGSMAGVPTKAPRERVFSMPGGGPEFLDPAKINETAGGMVGRQMFEGLVMPGHGTLKPRPGQAERWELSADGRTYTFHLREGLVWSDGTPLHADAFVYGWERVLNPATASRAAQIFWVIKGAKAYNSGKLKDFSQVGVSAPDPRTVVVTLENPTPYFLPMIAEVNFAPSPRHAVEKYGEQWTRPENIVVNGAFKMTVHNVRDRIVLEKNPRYWDAKNVWLEKVNFFHSESETTEFQWYETGKVQKTNTVPQDKVELLRQAGRSDLKIDPSLCTYYFVLNTRKPPFDDVRVRRAFNMAIDKERLTRHIVRGGRRPADHLVHDGFAKEGFEMVEGDDFDPEEARTLLSEAGFPNGTGFPPVTLVYNTFEAHRIIAEFTQRNIKENLGVEIQIQNVEWKSLLKLLHAGEYQMARSSWCADYPDPASFLEVFVTGGENNYPGYASPDFDKLLRQASAETNAPARKKLLAAAETMLLKDQPIIPVYFYNRIYLLAPYVRGHLPHLMDSQLMRDIFYDTGGGS